jgi:hypothetical protein
LAALVEIIDEREERGGWRGDGPAADNPEILRAESGQQQDHDDDKDEDEEKVGEHEAKVEG